MAITPYWLDSRFTVVAYTAMEGYPGLMRLYVWTGILCTSGHLKRLYLRQALASESRPFGRLNLPDIDTKQD